ncbi:MAG: DNA-binding protein [Planctomycetes bacterium]|nr:DNA-binding protein [Planctomycetota bacterium]
MARNFSIYLSSFPVVVFIIFMASITAFAEDTTTSKDHSGLKAGRLQSVSKPKPENREPQLCGKIVETMNSGGYTYLLLENEGTQIWVAISETKVSVGQDISLKPGHQMVNFTSKTLKRTFDRIIFSAGPLSGHGSSHTGGQAGIGSKNTTVHAGEKVEVKKAAGAGDAGTNVYTVEELFQKSKRLDKKNVALRGKVMKVSVGIMGKNWIHIQDGTGDEKNNTHDLVVTTQDQPAVDDIVRVEGILYMNKDFGSGYKYDTIIEEAHISKE